MSALVIPLSSVRSEVDPEEWEARVQLAAAYRLMHRLGMTDWIYNHITARVPSNHEHFLINPWGLSYSEITASNLYKIDLEGNLVLKPDIPFGTNQAGFIIHSAVHAARPDAGCIIHTHTKAGVAVSAMRCGLLPISQSAMRFSGRIGYHDYEGPATNLEERGRLAQNLGGGDVLVLRNHGMLVVGPTIHTAFHLHQRLEVACQVQCAAMAAGTELVIPSPEVQRHASATMDVNASSNAIPNGGEIEWAALVRELDREEPSYRD